MCMYLRNRSAIHGQLPLVDDPGVTAGEMPRPLDMGSDDTVFACPGESLDSERDFVRFSPFCLSHLVRSLFALKYMAPMGGFEIVA